MTDNAMREQARTLALCQGFPASAHRIACLNMKFNFINVRCLPPQNTKQNKGALDPPTYLDRRPGPDLKNKKTTRSGFKTRSACRRADARLTQDKAYHKSLAPAHPHSPHLQFAFPDPSWGWAAVLRPLMPSSGSAGKRQQRSTSAEPDDTKSTPPTGINRQLGLS